eukprot:127091-Chlamydomonas_euryale.AAC.1
MDRGYFVKVVHALEEPLRGTHVTSVRGPRSCGEVGCWSPLPPVRKTLRKDLECQKVPKTMPDRGRIAVIRDRCCDSIKALRSMV